jgi:replicative DNA helicase
MELETPPHSLEAERSVLGAALLSISAWHEIASILEPGDFYRAAHNRIFIAMRDLVRAGSAIDLITIKDELARGGALDECGGPSYVARLIDGVPRSTNAAHYARLVRDYARRRAGMAFAEQLRDDLKTGDEETAAIIEAAVRRLLKSVDVHDEGDTTAAGVMRQRYDELASETTETPIPTGFSELDRYITGVRRRSLTIVAARPGSGKTSLGLGMGENMAKAGHGVLWCTLEMEPKELGDRLLAWHSGVSIRDIENGDADPADYVRLSSSIAEVQDIPLHLVRSARTITKMAAWIHRLRGLGHPVDVLIVDYIQKMMPERRSDSRDVEVAAISDGLVQIAKDLGVAVIGMSQLKRPQQGKADKRPHMSDLRESGSLEQDAAMVLLIYREEMHKAAKIDNEGMAEIIIAKNRSGPIGVRKLYFQKRLARFMDPVVAG